MKRQRIIGTSLEAVRLEEARLCKTLPPSFVAWLLQNNGLDIEGVHIYPVKDDRDIRKTWDSISHNYENGWASWVANFEGQNIDFSNILPFANYGTGDYYCFDYSQMLPNGECSIVRWSHETGECEFRASTFAEFREHIMSGKYDFD